ncbi:MAG: FIST C-terminal domain-containing protein [Synergistaceae bacterium]|jgi:hypothetical protein|nr:FIST C-terminal domain-containing protein [Synergistaceae bacterium]
MIKMLTSFTEEIDDAKAAISDVLASLDIDNGLSANSVGILHCASDFAASSVVSELCAELPFDVLGCTTMGIQTFGLTSELALSITVLTSDDVGFAAGVSAPVEDDIDGPVSELYRRIVANRPTCPTLQKRPSLLIPYIPFMFSAGGDEFLAKIDELSGGIPAFGGLAISNEIDYSETYTIFNGEFFPTSLSLLAIFGDVCPVFLAAPVDNDNILKQKAVITGMKRNVLQTVNNIPAAEYLESLGLAENGDVSGLVSMPFIITLEDGSKLTRACIDSNEKGEVLLCGSAPLNSTLSLATIGSEDVVRSTGATVSEALGRAGGRGMLIYSSAARNWALGTNFTAEQDKVDECIGGSVPYNFSYCGGEIFPTISEDGRVSNQLQNDTMILCIL